MQIVKLLFRSKVGIMLYEAKWLYLKLQYSVNFASIAITYDNKLSFCIVRQSLYLNYYRLLYLII